ncbi:MAG TPA: cytochrome P450 [Methylomirabilota bacterium]|nr:cytochrome P450 [Methylomirabilota bacterium]
MAASAEAVTAALTSPLARVRPVDEPVPPALRGSPAAEIFGRLVRMIDGERHEAVKPAVTATLGALGAARVVDAAARWAGALAADIGPRTEPPRLARFALDLPVHVVASLLGVPGSEVPRIAGWAGELARGFAPGSAPERVERATAAAGELLERLQARLAEPATGEDGGFLTLLARTTPDMGATVANGIGFLTQAYEATAGLIGNTLRALAQRPALAERVRAAPGLVEPVMREVARHDPPVQNTRRFIAADGTLGGARMAAGDAVLVLLAAANRDPAANPDPHRFDPLRIAPRMFTFGVGGHACPGERLAVAIARAGVERVLAAGVTLEPLAHPTTYRASANGRIPLFGLAD